MAVNKKRKPIPMPDQKTPSQKQAVPEFEQSLEIEKKQQVIKQPMKRTSFDIPVSLYIAWKKDCAENFRKMSDDLREFLQEKYGDNS